MKTSGNGIALIQEFEGERLVAYQDIVGIWTIGFGHTQGVEPGDKITSEQAAEILVQDLGKRERAIERLVEVEINQNEFDALVSLIFNIGIGGFSGSGQPRPSTTLRKLNQDDRAGAADGFLLWHKATIDGVLTPIDGLKRRRARERRLFLAPWVAPVENRPDLPVDEDPPEIGEVAAPGACAGDIGPVAPPARKRRRRGFWRRLFDF